MNSTLAVPELPRVSGKMEAIFEPVKRARKNLEAPLSKIISKRGSHQKIENLLETLLAMLSVAYFIGAASFAGILIIHAFCN